jgi:hypothetical protein
MYCTPIKIEDLIGKTFEKVTRCKRDGNETIIFENEDETFFMTHRQDCCESVYIEDLTGNLEDLVGVPIVLAYETSNSTSDAENCDHSTWTFYRIGTMHGTVSIRWFGSSNGYYSESVDIFKEGR